MNGKPVDGDGETWFAHDIDRLFGCPGLRTQLPPCPPWPDLN
jgi:hypothetical protein